MRRRGSIISTLFPVVRLSDTTFSSFTHHIISFSLLLASTLLLNTSALPTSLCFGGAYWWRDAVCACTCAVVCRRAGLCCSLLRLCSLREEERENRGSGEKKEKYIKERAKRKEDKTEKRVAGFSLLRHSFIANRTSTTVAAMVVHCCASPHSLSSILPLPSPSPSPSPSHSHSLLPTLFLHMLSTCFCLPPPPHPPPSHLTLPRTTTNSGFAGRKGTLEYALCRSVLACVCSSDDAIFYFKGTLSAPCRPFPRKELVGICCGGHFLFCEQLPAKSWKFLVDVLDKYIHNFR